MKTIIFLLLFSCLAFACGSPEDIYLLKTDSGYFYFLTNYGGKEYTDDMFNKDYPQYANKTKKTYYGITAALSVIKMSEKYTENPDVLRKIVIVE